MIDYMSKEVYLAGKVDTSELSIADFSSELESRGHQVIEKWWEKELLPKPYLQYTETSITAAEAMIDAAYGSDVFILFPEDNILGAAVELGAAIASSRDNTDKQIIIVNPNRVRQSVFYAHPSVVAVDGLKRIRELDWF